jgi:hypothetical protein
MRNIEQRLPLFTLGWFQVRHVATAEFPRLPVHRVIWLFANAVDAFQGIQNRAIYTRFRSAQFLGQT